MSSSARSAPERLSVAVAQQWRHALPGLVLLVAWILYLYRDTAVGIVSIWSRSETFTHGFLVPPIVLWLIWRKREAMAAQSPRPMLGIFVLAAGTSFLWLMGDLVAINAVTQLALVTLLVLAVPAVLGWPVARLIAFPLGFLFFAVPVGEFLMPQLMEWTANFTVMALRLSGVPVYRDGLQFVIPSGNWSVVEACSGVRYLIASLTVGTLFAYLNYQSTQRRVLFVIVSILVPIVANWLRAYMIVMLGHYSGNTIAVGVDHLIYGWVFFGVVIMLMFVIGARWAEPDSLVNINVDQIGLEKPPFSATRLWLPTAGFAALLVLPHIALWAIDRSEGSRPVSMVAPNELSAGWVAVDNGAEVFKPSFQNPSAEINRRYVNDGRTVGMYLGYYRNQDYDRKLVTSSNVLVVSSDQKWAQVDSGRQVITLGAQSVTVRTAALRGAALGDHTNVDRLVAWQTYWINGTLTSSDYLAKVYGALYRLIGRGDDSAAIIVYTTKEQAGGEDALLKSFLSANYAAINELLQKTKTTSDSSH
jgi:exosortase A